jgi:hypothetical protein
MLSRETLEAYRRMTPSERLALTLQAMRESYASLLQGPPEVVDRRFELIRRENDARNRNMLERLAAAMERHEDT